MSNPEYSDAVDPERVGTYPILAKAGGGLVWDEVLEYRVWCHPERGAPDEDEGNDYCYFFASYVKALKCFQSIQGAEEPVALVLQREHIDEPESGHYVHVTEERVAEWPVEFLRRPRRKASTIREFLAPNAPPNRLDIILGIETKSR